MPRPRETPHVVLNTSITVPCAPTMVAFIDKHRATKSRQGYIRNLVRAEALRIKEAAEKNAPYKPSEDPGQREHAHDNPQGPEDTTP